MDDLDTHDDSAGDAGLSVTRRDALQASAALALLPLAGEATAGQAAAGQVTGGAAPGATLKLRTTVNRQPVEIDVDPRTSLLDLLRERLALTGAKKGCDHGQCGACTVLVDGRRVNACLTLAVMHEGDEITTVEGLADGDALHPIQAAFIRHDGFQCGYCTPGQICSAIGMLEEAKAGWPSHATQDVATRPALSELEIRERMSGNICRCAAYPNIVAAIRDVAEGA
jgi:xanthine dehydrogenase YagT iron-sulfur-binding subunit